MDKSLKRIFKYILTSLYILTHLKKNKLRKPNKIDILLVDRRSSQEAVLLFFNQFNYGYLDTRKEEINI